MVIIELLVIGDGINAGTEVVVLDRKSEYKELYDGAAVQVKKTIEAPVRITRPRVDELNMKIPEIESTFYVD